MCSTPNQLADGQLVACRKCGQCSSNRIDLWVGRCIAESKTSVATTSITLTYGRDRHGNKSHARAAILTYSDVQKYFKQLRNRGYPARYLMVGEHGSKKGRTHWHGIVFWQKDIPTSMTDYGNNAWNNWLPRDEAVERPIKWHKRFWDPCWPHGFSHWAPVTFGHEKGSVAYACKYINKDVDDPTSQTKLAMSKRPPIGSEYFIQRAQKFVDERIAPRDPFYQFPYQARRKNGKIINFMLKGKLLEIFYRAFTEKWHEQVGTAWPSNSFMLDVDARLGRAENKDLDFGTALRVPPGRWPMHPPFGYTERDIYISHPDKDDLGFEAPCVKTPAGYLWYGPDKEGKKGWRERIEKIDPPHRGRGGGLHCAQPIPRLSPWAWVVRLSERNTFWLSQSVTTLGRYRLAKHQPASGRRVWLRSQTQ